MNAPHYWDSLTPDNAPTQSTATPTPTPTPATQIRFPGGSPRLGFSSVFTKASRPGKVRPMILLWALGVPIPLILLLLLLRSCFG